MILNEVCKLEWKYSGVSAESECGPTFVFKDLPTAPRQPRQVTQLVCSRKWVRFKGLRIYRPCLLPFRSSSHDDEQPFGKWMLLKHPQKCRNNLATNNFYSIKRHIAVTPCIKQIVLSAVYCNYTDKLGDRQTVRKYTVTDQRPPIKQSKGALLTGGS